MIVINQQRTLVQKLEVVGDQVMKEVFKYDIYLSYSSKDKDIVRIIAECLREKGLKVWFDDWFLDVVGDNMEQIEYGLENSRVLVLCMSINACGSDWPKLESSTFRFRDPRNQDRRFVPLLLDESPIKASLEHFLHVNWVLEGQESVCAKLADACRPPPNQNDESNARSASPAAISNVQLGEANKYTNAFAFNNDGTNVITAGTDGKVRLWEIKSGECVRVFDGHRGKVNTVCWDAMRARALSGSDDSYIRLWDTDSGKCLNVLSGTNNRVCCIAWNSDCSAALSSSESLLLWSMATGHCSRKGHLPSRAWCLAWSPNQRYVVLGIAGELELWDLSEGKCIRSYKGHAAHIQCVTWSMDGMHFLSGSYDQTVRLWSVEAGRCQRVFEGHIGCITCIAESPFGRFAITGAEDRKIRLWDLKSGRCVVVLEGHKSIIRTVAWSSDGKRAFSGDEHGGVWVWDIQHYIPEANVENESSLNLQLAPDQVQYTNAKVLLVGESGSGKTGLSKVLAGDKWQPSDSTVGAWATQWNLPVTGGDGIEREIWLWDFGGQADQRLIHQLYMDETALAVLVFDGQKEDIFETLGQWDRDLTRASRKPFSKLLVAGRTDAGGLRVSKSDVEKFAEDHKFLRFLQTSAKTNQGCEDLRQAIYNGINWEEIPCRTTEVLFKRLKEEIICLKDEGRVLMRFNELRETLQLRLAGNSKQFSDDELRAVMKLLAGPGVVWELSFGSWVLMQPERINAYAQAVIRTLQGDEHNRGCIFEDEVLSGNLVYESSMERLKADDERFVLLAMHQTLVERGLCLRQPTDKGCLLSFPSYYRRERPEIVSHPAVLVSYQFKGFLDEIYATLVVRLHHTEAFDQEQLWRYAADFTTKSGKQLGIKLSRRAPGVGYLEVYFEMGIDDGEKIIFSKYVHEHLLQHASDVIRFRHYVCKHCAVPVGNQEEAMSRLNLWLKGRESQSSDGSWFNVRKGRVDSPSIICVKCETRRVPLWDELEQSFASPETQQRVLDMQEEVKIILSNQSKERALVGEVVSTVALANQICREFAVCDQGIDMEIEFTDDAYVATNQKLYLQLKSGDSYLHNKKSDGAEIFKVKNERWLRYWMASAYPVLLVVRSSDGEIRWMEIRDYLKRESDNGRRDVRQIVFTGERFDVMSIRRWRDKILAAQTI